jgi:hypothetical protein
MSSCVFHEAISQGVSPSKFRVHSVSFLPEIHMKTKKVFVGDISGSHERRVFWDAAPYSLVEITNVSEAIILMMEALTPLKHR